MKQCLAHNSNEWTALERFCLTRDICPAPHVANRDDNLYDTFRWHAMPAGDVPLHCRVFTDGSLLGGGWQGCAALGWAFVVLDDEDAVVCAAYGVPPKWFDSIQGAELWDVRMALGKVLFPASVFTDCKTVQVGVRQDQQWAQSAKRRYARLWTVLQTSLEEQGSAEVVHWMPPHTSAKSVGNVFCSDYSILTQAMRSANDMADMLAKAAAEGNSIGASARKWLKVRLDQAQELAIFVGRLTHLAGALRRADGTVARDSTGSVQARRRQEWQEEGSGRCPS